jgi:hypothetical protein
MSGQNSIVRNTFGLFMDSASLYSPISKGVCGVQTADTWGRVKGLRTLHLKPDRLLTEQSPLISPPF